MRSRFLQTKLTVFVAACTCTVSGAHAAEDPTLEALQKQAETIIGD